MALLDRLRDRFETDVAEPELERVLAEARAELVSRYGPDAGDGPIDIEVDPRGRPIVDLARPYDLTAGDLAIVEYLDGIGGSTSTTLVADDYTILNRGRTLRRRATGTNPRSSWGNRLALTYTPVDDTAQRDEATLKLAILALQYRAKQSTKVGDVTEADLDHVRERERLIGSVAPRRLLVR